MRITNWLYIISINSIQRYSHLVVNLIILYTYIDRLRQVSHHQVNCTICYLLADPKCYTRYTICSMLCSQILLHKAFRCPTHKTNELASITITLWIHNIIFMICAISSTWPHLFTTWLGSNTMTFWLAYCQLLNYYIPDRTYCHYWKAIHDWVKSQDELVFCLQ